MSSSGVERKTRVLRSTSPSTLNRLTRYEVHLDRKLERTLTMLIRLQDLRRGSPEPDPFRKNGKTSYFGVLGNVDLRLGHEYR